TNEQELRLHVLRAAKLTTMLIVPACIGLILLGPLLLDFFGNTYRVHGRDLLYVLALSGPVMGGVGICSIFMRITKQTKALVGINALYVVATCGSGLLLIHKGIIWAGVAWLIGQLVSLILMLPIVANHRQLSATKPAGVQNLEQ